MNDNSADGMIINMQTKMGMEIRNEPAKIRVENEKGEFMGYIYGNRYSPPIYYPQSKMDDTNLHPNADRGL